MWLGQRIDRVSISLLMGIVITSSLPGRDMYGFGEFEMRLRSLALGISGSIHETAEYSLKDGGNESEPMKKLLGH